ncbi:hypothetical protein MJT46_004536 [Ovis ammon polii x Ovis aries]|nr:hypothetical protein MJT46_004536 [Ovis ammon polii x Ovis aries]
MRSQCTKTREQPHLTSTGGKPTQQRRPVQPKIKRDRLASPELMSSCHYKKQRPFLLANQDDYEFQNPSCLTLHCHKESTTMESTRTNISQTSREHIQDYYLPRTLYGALNSEFEFDTVLFSQDLTGEYFEVRKVKYAVLNRNPPTPWTSSVSNGFKNPPAVAVVTGSIPGLGRSHMPQGFSKQIFTEDITLQKHNGDMHYHELNNIYGSTDKGKNCMEVGIYVQREETKKDISKS